MFIGEKIQNLRQQQIISQEQLALQLNVPHQTVIDWEQDKALPDIINIVNLSEIFNVTTDYLLKTANQPAGSQWWEVPSMYSAAKSKDSTDASWQYAAYPLALIAFLVMGFAWGLWHPGWLAFTVAWAVDELAELAKPDRQAIELYGLASLVFLILGFYFDLWQVSWLAYIVAMVIEWATTPEA